ncbi:reticulon-like protein B6 isoform X1 [Elaeis guineensis]|uniref:Reticulon-like protein n=1 Tax=Elaeis guineensis var. tenera TaxID=51953 RepID=A0A6J0PNF1_ELAGV|nr:reticulon-like protein B6 isoform X1 [Elaeis guineensis]XP_019708814.1 reticulon-like protein B6 isoform X1 [Elaeis guineensis]XP_029122636.1 reticulon-like protein B6 isoform X1 [Elaeis guineensis]XP_029122637.1 reticulon-like protein B6 isoform X1 [Elaeis guineensis]XP_029122639.1 reticulon-like protein B6 isoform X1 [Elaeis guineensis]
MAEAAVEETIHEYKGSSSSDSESEKPPSPGFKKKRLFGRKEPVHTVLGGGKPADIVLWRNKQMSASILAGVTVLWLLFECIGYHFLTFICHSLIFFLVVLFLWSNAASFVNRPPPNFPEVILPEDLFLSIVHSVRHKVNETFAIFRYVASGKDLKKFLMVKLQYLISVLCNLPLILSRKIVVQVVTGLWVLSKMGSWFSFLTFFYIVFVLLYSLPALYEKYEDQVDAAAEKAIIQMNKQYAVLDEKLLCKIPRCPFSGKKQH